MVKLGTGAQAAQTTTPFYCDWRASRMLSLGANAVEISYKSELDLSAVEFIDVLQRSTLGQRRPVDDVECIEAMLRNADLTVTARNADGKLLGVSRALTDFSFCTYLSDLAVDVEAQGQGIGKRLIDETHRLAGLKTTLILLAAPAARTYYPHIGLSPHDSCWIIPPTNG